MSVLGGCRCKIGYPAIVIHKSFLWFALHVCKGCGGIKLVCRIVQKGELVEAGSDATLLSLGNVARFEVKTFLLARDYDSLISHVVLLSVEHFNILTKRFLLLFHVCKATDMEF